MNLLREFFSKYLFPVILILIGLLIVLVSKGQTELFVLGGVAILGIGIISILYILGIINRLVQIILSVLLVVAAAIFIYLDYDVIDDEMAEMAKRQKIATHVIQRLKDIRTAELAYLKVNESYTGNFDTLIHFVKTAKFPVIKKLGTLPDSVPTEEMAAELGIVSSMPPNMTDEQVLDSGLLVRDTIYIGVLESTFLTDEALAERKAPFHVDSLAKVPFSNHEFELKAGHIEVSGVKQPVFQALDPKPYAKQYIVGSMTQASTSGNWSE